MKLYVFRTLPLSIIRIFSLYTQQWYMSYRYADSLRAGIRMEIVPFYHGCVYSKKLLVMGRETVRST